MLQLTKNLREATELWLADYEWHFYVTLNFNCSTSYNAARRKFGAYCQRIDRKSFGRRYMEMGDQRVLIVAFPEHLDSNAHFHCLVKFRSRRPFRRSWMLKMIEDSWVELLASGTVDIQDADNVRSRVSYSTKNGESGRFLERYIVSSEFHPT